MRVSGGHIGDMPAVGLSLDPVVQSEFGLSSAQVFMSTEWWVGAGVLCKVFCQKERLNQNQIRNLKTIKTPWLPTLFLRFPQAVSCPFVLIVLVTGFLIIRATSCTCSGLLRRRNGNISSFWWYIIRTVTLIIFSFFPLDGWLTSPFFLSPRLKISEVRKNRCIGKRMNYFGAWASVLF